jgi:hypothetical protein
MKGMGEFWHEQQAWSESVFGTTAERGPEGPAKHLALEVLHEILDMPKSAAAELVKPLRMNTDLRPEANSGESWDFLDRLDRLTEWADLIFLVFDACRRDGFSYDDLLAACWTKLAINKSRVWGPRTPAMPVEHVRGGEGKP